MRELLLLLQTTARMSENDQHGDEHTKSCYQMDLDVERLFIVGRLYKDLSQRLSENVGRVEDFQPVRYLS